MNIERLRRNLTFEKNLLQKCRRSIKKLPEGGLTCFTRNGNIYYKKNSEGTQKYLGTIKQPEVQELQKRHLLENMIRVLEKNTMLTEALITGYKDYHPEKLQKGFSNAYQNLNLEMFSELGLMNPSVQSVYMEDGKKYKTSSGLLVRSRIEVMIADLYTQKGIPFEYEPALKLQDGNILHPDFRIYSASDNRYLYHEHIGMLSDKEYMKSYLWKFERYINEGLYPDYDVLFTYEKPGEGIDLHELSCMIDLFVGR